MKLTIPMRLHNPLNGPQGTTRGAQMKRAAERKRERRDAYYHVAHAAESDRRLRAEGGQDLREALLLGDIRRALREGGITVLLTRVAPRFFDDDGLVAAFKSVRDGVADWLGADDGSDLVTWCYTQERGRPREHAVRIEIAPRTLAPEWEWEQR